MRKPVALVVRTALFAALVAGPVAQAATPVELQAAYSAQSGAQASAEHDRQVFTTHGPFDTADGRHRTVPFRNSASRSTAMATATTGIAPVSEFGTWAQKGWSRRPHGWDKHATVESPEETTPS